MNKIVSSLFSESLEAILQHSDSVESILSRKKVSRELLFNYLHWKKVTTDSNLDKKSLGSMVINYWKSEKHQETTGSCHQSLNTSQRIGDSLVSQVSQVYNL